MNVAFFQERTSVRRFPRIDVWPPCAAPFSRRTFSLSLSLSPFLLNVDTRNSNCACKRADPSRAALHFVATDGTAWKRRTPGAVSPRHGPITSCFPDPQRGNGSVGLEWLWSGNGPQRLDNRGRTRASLGSISGSPLTREKNRGYGWEGGTC